MAYKKENMRRARLIIDERNSSARARSDARSAELRERFPQIKEIDSILQSTALRMMEAASLGSEGFDGRVAAIREENLLLREKRAEFLRSQGLAPDYDDVKYTCPLCSDSGFIDGKICSCLQKLLREEAIRESGLAHLIGEQTFERFSLDYYTDRDSAGRVKRECERFAANPCGNVYLYGATGLGKTHLCTAVAERALSGGYYVIYESAQKIFSDFESVRFRPGDREAVDRLFDCDLLIIDDLGCEYRNPYTSYALYDVINTRINQKKPMFISSNLRGQSIADAYGDRIFSRIAGEFTLLSLEGKDIRMQKKMK